MNKNALKKILEHPDKDELIAKLVLDYAPKEIHEWLAGKYTDGAGAPMRPGKITTFNYYPNGYFQLETF